MKKKNVEKTLKLHSVELFISSKKFFKCKENIKNVHVEYHLTLPNI